MHNNKNNMKKLNGLELTVLARTTDEMCLTDPEETLKAFCLLIDKGIDVKNAQQEDNI